MSTLVLEFKSIDLAKRVAAKRLESFKRIANKRAEDAQASEPKKKAGKKK